MRMKVAVAALASVGAFLLATTDASRAAPLGVAGFGAERANGTLVEKVGRRWHRHYYGRPYYRPYYNSYYDPYYRPYYYGRYYPYYGAYGYPYYGSYYRPYYYGPGFYGRFYGPRFGFSIGF